MRLRVESGGGGPTPWDTTIATVVALVAAEGRTGRVQGAVSGLGQWRRPSYWMLRKGKASRH